MVNKTRDDRVIAQMQQQEGVWCGAGARGYMEDRHTVVPSYTPALDAICRSFAGVYDGHNGAKAAEHCCSRWVWTLAGLGMHLPPYALPCSLR